METHEIISRKTLCGCFSLLRQSLNNWQAGNLYFLNSHALYHHLSALPCGKDTVGGILTQMESCIPMALTTDSLEKFLLAKSPAEAEDFLDMCMAAVCKNMKEVREYFDETGADIAGMSKEELEQADEVFKLPDGRYLVVDA